MKFIMCFKNTKIVKYISFSLSSKLRNHLGRLIRKLTTSESKSNLSSAQKIFLFNEFKHEIDDFGELLVSKGVINLKEELYEKWGLD